MNFFDILVLALPEVDEFTLKSARHGDKRAIEELLSFYEKKVYNISLKLLQNAHDASDCAQESLIKVFNSLGKFKGDASFSSWVYRITANTATDFLRKRTRLQAVSLSESEEDGFYIKDIDPASSPEEMLKNTQLSSAIMNAITSLPDEQKKVIILCDVEGFAYDEIADILQVSIGTVKSRIFRGREKLKVLLRDIV